jgi:hypothetical protein
VNSLSPELHHCCLKHNIIYQQRVKKKIGKRAKKAPVQTKKKPTLARQFKCPFCANGACLFFFILKSVWFCYSPLYKIEVFYLLCYYILFFISCHLLDIVSLFIDVRYIASCTLFIPIILFFLSTCALSSAQWSSADLFTYTTEQLIHQSWSIISIDAEYVL